MLSTEAKDLLRKLLAIEVANQVKDGRGEEPLSDEWTELYDLSIGFK